MSGRQEEVKAEYGGVGHSILLGALQWSWDRFGRGALAFLALARSAARRLGSSAGRLDGPDGQLTGPVAEAASEMNLSHSEQSDHHETQPGVAWCDGPKGSCKKTPVQVPQK